MKRFKKGFTLAEVLITLAIIGVVAAISIPSVISNSQQQEFKTGLRKAVSVLNSYDNKDLPRYLMRHMNIISSTSQLSYYTITKQNNSAGSYNQNNAAFYTVDGMRFEFNHAGTAENPFLNLHESNVHPCDSTNSLLGWGNTCNGCGSYGLNNNKNATTKPRLLALF